MDENIVSKSTVTGKRQITIPKEICKILNIETGQQVIFKKEGDKIIFESEKEYDICFACNGTSKLGEHECFICKGTGKLEKDISDDIYKLIFYISRTAKKYDIGYSLIQRDVDAHGNSFCKEFPEFKLNSDRFSKTDLLRIQNEIQKIIIKQFSSSSINMRCAKEEFINERI